MDSHSFHGGSRLVKKELIFIANGEHIHGHQCSDKGAALFDSTDSSMLEGSVELATRTHM